MNLILVVSPCPLVPLSLILERLEVPNDYRPRTSIFTGATPLLIIPIDRACTSR